jgi:hypothetical protein
MGDDLESVRIGGREPECGQPITKLESKIADRVLMR